MQLTRYLAAMGLSVLLAMPAAAQTTPPSKSPSSPAVTKPDTTSKSPPATASQAPASLVDINSASAEELDKLPGVGPARVKAIIANRPYNGKDDLRQRKIIPPNVYNQIKDKIIARQGPTK
jgi:DNA uptake protein ComE-like DNA-binding protein